MKKTIIILSAFFFICYQSCTIDPSEYEIEYQLPPTFQSTNKIRYNVEGGGDIVAPPGNQAETQRTQTST